MAWWKLFGTYQPEGAITELAKQCLYLSGSSLNGTMP